MKQIRDEVLTVLLGLASGYLLCVVIPQQWRCVAGIVLAVLGIAATVIVAGYKRKKGREHDADSN